LNPVTSTSRTSVHIGASSNLELVDKFYLDNVLSVENRIEIGWNKFRQLVSLFTNKDISLIT